MIVYFCSTVGSVITLFPRPAERLNISASAKGPLSIIKYLLILSACRQPIYVGFLLNQAQGNLLFVERYSIVCTERLFTDNSLEVETVRNYPTWAWKYLHRQIWINGQPECSALGFSYVRWKPRKNAKLAKMRSFHQSKRSYNKRYAVKVRWGIFFENLTYYFIP